MIEFSLPTIATPSGSPAEIVSEAYQTISASFSLINSAVKSCAFNGMKITVCVAKGARSKSVAEFVVKHAE